MRAPIIILLRRIRLRLVCAISVVALLTLGAARAQPDVVFMASSPTNQYEASVYQTIWNEDGERIVAALEAQTCLSFPETRVWAAVAEATSHSGGPDHPMRLRASYIRPVKQSTLVHELGHRHLWQLVNRLDNIDGHMTLFLVLDRVWAEVWGEEFSSDRVRGEAGWGPEYASAWAWARSLDPEKRRQLWNQLLTMNGFLNDCNRSNNSAGAG